VHKNQIRYVSELASKLWKHIQIYSEVMYRGFKCNNVAKHAEFYLA
jgi:hypothetical protein